MLKQARLIQRRDFACQHGDQRTLNTARERLAPRGLPLGVHERNILKITRAGIIGALPR